MSEPDVDVVIIGAGVVGLAVARSLADAGREVLILESAARIGSGTSSRNSEVVHAGIYYAPGSLKARLCRQGREQLYAFCTERAVPHRRTGKLIVARGAAQSNELAAIERRARTNGVEDLQRLDGAAVMALEPALEVDAALLSPSTGIVDSHALMLSLLAQAQAGGAMLATRAPVETVRAERGGFLVRAGGEAPTELRCTALVNAAGLSACSVAGRIRGLDARFVPRARFARGCYYRYAGRVPFSRLVYPVPEPGGLGVHLTLDLAGNARFGPDVQWIDREDYSIPAERRAAFVDGVKAWWPELPEGSLEPDYAGVRPKIERAGDTVTDFEVQGPREHGVDGLVNLFGIESPGLTASLALGELVRALLARTGPGNAGQSGTTSAPSAWTMAASGLGEIGGRSAATSAPSGARAGTTWLGGNPAPSLRCAHIRSSACFT